MTPEVLETLEFPEALARVAAHAAGPLGAASISARQPSSDAADIRSALAQVAELAALLITDDTIRAEPVPDITTTLELLAVPGSVLEGPALAELTVALSAMHVVAADLKRLDTQHAARRTASLRVDPPPKELETKLKQSIAPDGAVLDGASRELARARQHVREARQRVIDKLGAILGGLDVAERAPDAAVTVRNGRYVIPVRNTARSRVGGIVHDESATRSTVFVEPPEVIELGNELRAAESAEQREVLRVLRELTDLIRPHQSVVAAGWEMCIAFDVFRARRRVAWDSRWRGTRLACPARRDRERDRSRGGRGTCRGDAQGVDAPQGHDARDNAPGRAEEAGGGNGGHRQRVAAVRRRDAHAHLSPAERRAGTLVWIVDCAAPRRLARRVGGSGTSRAGCRAHAGRAAGVRGGTRSRAGCARGGARDASREAGGRSRALSRAREPRGGADGKGTSARS